MTADVKFPHISVKLTGLDGNAFSIIGRVRGELRKGGATPAEIAEYLKEAMAGDYNHLLAVTMQTVDVR